MFRTQFHNEICVCSLHTHTHKHTERETWPQIYTRQWKWSDLHIYVFMYVYMYSGRYRAPELPGSCNFQLETKREREREGHRSLLANSYLSMRDHWSSEFMFVLRAIRLVGSTMHDSQLVRDLYRGKEREREKLLSFFLPEFSCFFFFAKYIFLKNFFTFSIYWLKEALVFPCLLFFVRGNNKIINISSSNFGNFELIQFNRILYLYPIICIFLSIRIVI